MDFILECNPDGTVLSLDTSFDKEMIFHRVFNGIVLQEIGKSACESGNLTVLDLRDTEIIAIRTGAFLFSKIQQLYLPTTCKIIEFNAFGNTSIEYVNITANVEEMDSCAWNQIQNVKYFNVSIENKNFLSIDGYLFNKNGTILYGVPRKLQNQNEIPNFHSLQGIGSCAFTFSKLKNFIGTKTLSKIDEYSFHVTKNIKLINLKNTSITEIPYCAFRVTSAQYIILPSLLTDIKSQAVSRASNLRSIVIPSNVSSISSAAIDECTLLSHVFYFGLFDHSHQSIFNLSHFHIFPLNYISLSLFTSIFLL